MFIPEKTYTDNPFMDNVLYYAKILACNATIKDEAEALQYETKESLEKADILIACVENRAMYDMFDYVPVSILENYITLSDNLDIYIKDPQWLKNHMDSYSKMNRTKILDRLSSLARTVYIDHYDIMVNYIKSIDENWLENHLDLYNRCKNGNATYIDLFDELPLKTNLRIIRTYLNSHGYIDLAIIWDPNSDITKEDLKKVEDAAKYNKATADAYYNDSIRNMLMDTEYIANSKHFNNTYSNYKNQFMAYVDIRTDDDIIKELDNISKAMREVFASHYEIMQERKYLSQEVLDNIVNNTQSWQNYIYDKNIYDKCKTQSLHWYDLWDYIPQYSVEKALNFIFGSNDVTYYGLSNNKEALQMYIDNILDSSTSRVISLNQYMMTDYMNNYQIYLNRYIYDECINGTLSIYDMYEYLPKETLKSILNTEIPISTNLDAFSKSKIMRDSYLESIDPKEAKSIRDGITKEMTIWYPNNYEDLNNYYRALCGHPPLDKNGKRIIDTLEHTYIEKNKEFKEFGSYYINQCPTDVYPRLHWKNELYTYDNYDVNVLTDNGILENYITNGCESNNNVIRYRYLKYLGDNALNAYMCRKASNFDLLYLPSVDNNDILNKFIDTYNTNREYIIRCVYDDAYNFQSDYYNKLMIIFILVNTIMDICASIPDYFITRTVFDARCIKYLFESMGIPYYDEIPLKYQQAMLKNLNILIKYKSSTKNMIDLCNIFGYNDVQIFEYYMIKNRHKDKEDNFIPTENNDITYDKNNLYIKYSQGNITDVTGDHYSSLADYPYLQEDYYFKTIKVLNSDGTTTDKKIINNEREDIYVYDKYLGQMIPLKDSSYFTSIKANTTPASLEFIKVPINESLIDYKGIDDYVNTYNDITQEQTWDGGLDHEKLKQRILDYNFNAVKTKYISVDATSELSEIAFQTSYFYNMLLDNLYAEDQLTLKLESIKNGHNFRLTDVIFFMFAMMYYYLGYNDSIVYNPSQILYIKGYSFNKVINEILNDDSYFAQTDSKGALLPDDAKYSIFNVNTQIDTKKYDYQEFFNRSGIYTKAFNLEADIDKIEKWLQTEWKMSLNDFIVSDDVETFGQIVTLMQFYSLNNSFYQKNIFSGNMLPIQYNQIIKYAYKYDLAKKVTIQDIGYRNHYYIVSEAITNDTSRYGFIIDLIALVSKSYDTYTYDELLDKVQQLRSYELLSNYAYILDKIFSIDDGTVDIINENIVDDYYNYIIESDNINDIYVLNHNKYAGRYLDSNNPEKLAIYNRYVKNNNGEYELYTKQYYIYNRNTLEYNILISGFVYIRNDEGIFTFAANNIYKSDSKHHMEEIDYDRFTVYDDEIKARVLNYGNYYIRKPDGTYILDPDNCYIYGIVDGVEGYILLKDVENYVAKYINTNDCYVRLESGKFLQFLYTDFYIRTHKDYNDSNEMIYEPDNLYIKVDYVTDIQDPDDSSVYYRLLDDFYKDNMFLVNLDTLYVKDPYGNYIKESDLLIPSNTYFFDKIDNSYHLVSEAQFNYIDYEDKLNVVYLLIKQPNLDYNRYAYESNTSKYIPVPEDEIRYVCNSDPEYITIMYNGYEYSNDNKVLVILNEEYFEDINITFGDSKKYNPSLNDNIWDENDWYYENSGYDENNSFNMHGENKWYYLDPSKIRSNTNNIEDINNINEEQYVGSGFYFDASSFIGKLELIKDETYYIAFDLETNFTGEIRVVCTFDDALSNTQSHVYNVIKYQTIHINQIFKSNANGKPQIRFLKHNFNKNPINKGDYFLISNMRFMKANSDQYVAKDIPGIDQLLKIYKTNKAIYKWLLTKLHNTSDKKMYDIYKKLYDSLMISNYNKEIFKLPDNTYALSYTDFLRTRDTILYDILISLKNMDPTLMKTQISNYIIDIVYALHEYLGTDTDLEYIFSYFPGVSNSYIQQYLIKVVNWFKSWKVQMLGIDSVYKLGSGISLDADGNIIAPTDGDDYMVHILYHEKSKLKMKEYLKETFIKDELKISPDDGISPDGTPFSEKYDMNNKMYVNNDIGLKHRLRIMVDNGNSLEYTDNQSNLRLNLNDDSTNVHVKDGHLLNINTINRDEFTVLDKNNLIIDTNEDIEDVFTAQIIDEINYMSGDYITYEKDKS